MRPGRSLRVVLVAVVLILSGAGKLAAAPAPVITIEPPAPAREGLTLAAIVRDAAGRPVAGAPVTFTLRTAFGRLPAGRATTDTGGKASVTVGDLRVRTVTVAVALERTPAVGGGEAAASFHLDHAPERRPRRGLTSPDAPATLILFLVFVLSGVWSAYGYIFYQMARIRSAPSPTSGRSRLST